MTNGRYFLSGTRLAFVVAATALTLSACGSQAPAQSSAGFTPEGSAAAQSSTAAQPTATNAEDPFPGVVNFDFGPLPAGQEDAEVATTDRDFLLAYYEAIYTRGKYTGYKSYISNSGMLSSVEDDIASQVAEHRGYRGTVRFFDITVTTPPYFSSDLSVNYCVDESQFAYTNITTGEKTTDTRTPDQHYYEESDMFAQNSSGAWRLTGDTYEYYPDGQAKECKA
jgi:hypothetical protein